MSHLVMLLVSLFLVSFSLNGVVLAWSPAAALFASASNYFADPFFFSSPWMTSQNLPSNNIPVESKSARTSETAQVHRLISATHDKVNYIMVENVTLGFEQAESYCRTKFSDPMHLASVHSEVEWSMITKAFGQLHPMDIWLGGTIRHPRSKVFRLIWIDGTSVDYHRFSSTEQQRWVSNWRVHSHGCIVANLERPHQGNWSVEFAPCTTPRAFICKESKARPETTTAHVRLIARHISPLTSDPVSFDDLMEHVLFPYRRMTFSRFKFPSAQSFSVNPNRGQLSNRRASVNGKSEYATTPKPFPSSSVASKPYTSTQSTTEQITQPPSTTSSQNESQTEKQIHSTHEPKNGTTETSDADSGTISQQKTPSGASTRIIHISKPTLLQSKTLLPNLIEEKLVKKPKFIIFPKAAHSPSEASVVRMPVPKSNAQVIYPRTIWDLA